jgi:hypothetical protein
MRPRQLARPAASAARGSILLSLGLLAGCGESLSQQSVSTSSLPPRPEAGMLRDSPPPYERTGSLGESYRPPQPNRPYAWNGRYEPMTTGALPAHRYSYSGRWQPAPPPRTAMPASAGYGAPQFIDVEPGDTLYSLSRRHGVSVAELITANRLDNVNLQAGQRLVLPAGRR